MFQPLSTLLAVALTATFWMQPALAQLQTRIVASGLDRPLLPPHPPEIRGFSCRAGGLIKVLKTGRAANAIPGPVGFRSTPRVSAACWHGVRSTFRK